PDTGVQAPTVLKPACPSSRIVTAEPNPLTTKLNGFSSPSLFANDISPVDVPTAASNRTPNVVLAPGANVVIPKLDARLNPAGTVIGSVRVRLAVPTFLIVNVLVTGTPTEVEP